MPLHSTHSPRRTNLRLRIAVTVCLTACLAAAAAPPARADTPIAKVAVRFQMLIAGAEAAILEIDAKLSEKSYTVQGNGKTTGLIDLFARMRFSGTSKGAIDRSILRPARHQHQFSERGRSRNVTLTYDKRGHLSVKAKPDFDPSRSRVPLREKHMTGTVDPASVFVVPAVAGAGILDPKQCSRSVAVLDGQIRFDVSLKHLSSSKREKFKGSNYEGPVLRCRARIKPVGGYKKTGFIADLAKRKNIEVWLAPVAGERYLIPLRVSLPTPIGQAELRARRIVVEPAAQRASLGN